MTTIINYSDLCKTINKIRSREDKIIKSITQVFQDEVDSMLLDILPFEINDILQTTRIEGTEFYKYKGVKNDNMILESFSENNRIKRTHWSSYNNYHKISF